MLGLRDRQPTGAPGAPAAPTSRPGRRRVLRLGVRVILVGVALVLVYTGATFAQVWHASRGDEAQEAGAIIVLGAAQYNGRPSPVLAARLDHAAALYEEGLAPLVVVTGGRQPGDPFTEAGAAAAYLEGRGVPGTAIERETTSTNSWESLAAAGRFLRERGIDDVLLVSDPYHAFRIDAIADELGLTAHVSPTGTSPIGGFEELRHLGRETVAVAIGRIIGYDRLVRLDGEVR